MKQVVIRLGELRQLVRDRALTIAEQEEYERLIRLEGPLNIRAMPEYSGPEVQAYKLWLGK